MRNHILAAMLVAGPLAAPALAADDPSPTLFDQRVGVEWQSWTWSGGTASPIGYNSPMTVFTVTDHSGVLLGAATTVAKNEGRRRAAEEEAIRNDKRSYTYQVEEGHALEGTRFSFTVGLGGVNGAYGPTGSIAGATNAVSHMARLDLEGDIVPIGPGSLVFQTGIASWSTVAPATAATSSDIKLAAFDWPLGLAYRFAPSFLPGLVIQPSANFNWLYTAAAAVNGGAKWDAHNLGVEVGYYLLPTVKVRGAYFLDRLANDVSGSSLGAVADMKAASLGVTATF